MKFPNEAVVEAPPRAAEYVIRGVHLPFDELVNRSLLSAEKCASLREQLLAGKPYPHLVIKDIFNPRLLELVVEEFDDLPAGHWADVKSRYESHRRSVFGAEMGPATQLYFQVVNSGWFAEWLAAIIGAENLLPDPKLWGGGLHESRTGSAFAVHRDFNHHPVLGLKNEMVFITYLNKGWDPSWGSALELWDKKANQCVTMVQPEFGHTILLPHGPDSYHGYTHPLNAADGRPRRSVAAYYYTSPLAGKQHAFEGTAFMRKQGIDRFKAFARMVTPPVVWTLARKVKQR
ncbi:MAG TPA: 2OG-Fe(II) oxygenase [Variovorax sp.]|jgi:Rps23 Pro-64 3,4-dihydroxylase Tpa1-like proline 4-hydroxylase